MKAFPKSSHIWHLLLIYVADGGGLSNKTHHELLPKNAVFAVLVIMSLSCKYSEQRENLRWLIILYMLALSYNRLEIIKTTTFIKCVREGQSAF